MTSPVLASRSNTLPLRVTMLALMGIVILVLGSFVIGPLPLSPAAVAQVFAHRLGLIDDGGSDMVRRVVLEVRGPRIGAALLVGAALAVAGATYQNLFRNPLVSPGVLGVSAGAGFGAALGLLIDATGLGRAGTGLRRRARRRHAGAGAGPRLASATRCSRWWSRGWWCRPSSRRWSRW